jgi:hypothetical protein
MKAFSLFLALIGLVVQTQAQVSFQPYPVPAGTDNSNYRLVVDYHTNNQILFPVLTSDTVYVKNGINGTFSMIDVGLYITAYYSNSGDLYLVENADINGYEPHLFRSEDNGITFSETLGVAGRLFQRDQYGNLFYSIANGFAYSTNNGANFIGVITPDTVYNVALNAAGSLFLLSDSVKLLQSDDGGQTWTDISKTYLGNTFLEQHLWVESDTIYFQTASYFNYAEVDDSDFSLILPTQETAVVTNVYVSVDNAFFCLSPYGFFTSNNPASGNWNLLYQIIGSPQATIYNNYIAVSNSYTFVYTNSGYYYAVRTPNPAGNVTIANSGKQMNVFPNPANAFIQVNSKQFPVEFNLYSVQGKLVLNKMIYSDAETLDILELTPGMYIWKLGDKQGKILINQAK